MFQSVMLSCELPEGKVGNEGRERQRNNLVVQSEQVYQQQFKEVQQKKTFLEGKEKLRDFQMKLQKSQLQK